MITNMTEGKSGQVWNGREYVDVIVEGESPRQIIENSPIQTSYSFKEIPKVGGIKPEDFRTHIGAGRIAQGWNGKEWVDLKSCGPGPVGDKGKLGVDGFDPVDKPSHYNQGEIECIDAIAVAVKNLKGIEAVYTGNIIKYMWRWKEKGQTPYHWIEDLNKAKKYIEFLIKEIENEG